MASWYDGLMATVQRWREEGVPRRTLDLVITKERMRLLQRKRLREGVGFQAGVCATDRLGRLFMVKHLSLGEKVRKKGVSEKYIKGLWSNPGGWVEEGETFELAAIREFREETGLTASNLRIAGILKMNVSASESKPCLFYDAEFRAKISGGPLSLDSSEVTGADFFSWKAVREMVKRKEAPEAMLRIFQLVRGVPRQS